MELERQGNILLVCHQVSKLLVRDFLSLTAVAPWSGYCSMSLRVLVSGALAGYYY